MMARKRRRAIQMVAHRAATFEYFYPEVDGSAGEPSLPSMVFKGIAVTDDTAFASELYEPRTSSQF